MSRYIDTVDAAKMIRTALKGKFPGVKFSVKSSRYAGGSSIHIDWEDGPTEKKVRELTQPYAGASFDGMIDMQHYKTAILLKDGSVTWGKSDGTVDSRGSDPGYHNELPEGAEYVRFGCDYVQTSRGFTYEAMRGLVEKFNKEELRSEESPLFVENNKWGPSVRTSDWNQDAFRRFGHLVQETDL